MFNELDKIKQPTDLNALTKPQLFELQKALLKLGYPVGKIDGILGFRTEGSFHAFKKDSNQGNLSMIGQGSVSLLKQQIKAGENTVGKINQAGLDLIKEFEGFRTNAYLCPANVWTVGYGATYYEDRTKIKPGDVVSKQRGEELLKNTVKDFENAVTQLVKVPLTPNQFAALVSFAFNVGVGAFSKSTLLKVLNQNNYDQAANELLRWNKGGGRVLPGLTRRREAERKLFLS